MQSVLFEEWMKESPDEPLVPDQLTQIMPGVVEGPNIFNLDIGFTRFLQLYEIFQEKFTWHRHYHCYHYYYYWKDLVMLYDKRGRSKVYRRAVTSVKYSPDGRFQFKKWRRVESNNEEIRHRKLFHAVEKIHKYTLLNDDIKASFEIIVNQHDARSSKELLETTQAKSTDIYQLRIEVLCNNIAEIKQYIEQIDL